MIRNSKKSFTLVELLIVLAIIGILASIVLVSMGRARQKAKIAKAQAETRQIYNAILMFEYDTEQWPGHQEPNIVCTDLPGGCPGNNELCDDGCTNKLSDGAGGLVSDDGSDPYTNWNGPYLTLTQLIDPWGNEYFFDTDYDLDSGPGEEWVVVIGSYGPNGVGWNQYDDDDVLYIIRK